MTTIFDKLEQANICYAVGVAIDTFAVISAGISNRDYFLIVNEKDKEQAKQISRSFLLRDENFDVLEFTLNKKQILQFKQIRHKFDLVIDEREGRIYELKNNSYAKNNNHKTIRATTKERA